MNSTIKYIDNDKDLQKVVETLSKRKAIYIDLEFDKNHFRYGFNLCLMQIYDGEFCYLIDPLKKLNIELIFPVLEDEQIQLVCFAFNEDMRLLHYIGAHPSNIFDLAVTTRLLNHDSLSLNNTLSTFLGEKSPVVDKSNQQKSNWFQRPLTEKQHVYAAEDVLYLPMLQAEMKKRLEEQNRMKWMQEEMQAFENHDWSGGEKVVYLTKKDQKKLTPREWVRFKKMMDYREELASDLNRPTYKVINKQIVLDLASSPEKISDWTTTKGIHPKYKTTEVQAEFKKLLSEAEQEIIKESIPKNHSINPPITNEKKNNNKPRRKDIQEAKENFLIPIKEELKKEEGENFANYFLSNRKMIEFITEEQSFLNYQKELIVKTAKKLDLHTPPSMVALF